MVAAASMFPWLVPSHLARLAHFVGEPDQHAALKAHQDELRRS